MRVNSFAMPIIVVVALLGTAFGAQALGLWSTSGRTSVDSGNLVPEDLKGWMTLQQVVDGIGISQSELYRLAGIPADVPASTALKDLEGLVPGFEVSVLRESLAAYLAGEAPAPVPATATPVTPVPTATPVPVTPAAHTGDGGDGTGSGPTPLPPGQVLPADQIRGRMTLRQVSEQCAVPLDALLAALGLPADTNPDTAIKDLVSAGQIAEVSTVQSAVAALQK